MPILADTSIWSHHFRRRDERLVSLLGDRQIVLHPWIVGELALGPGMRVASLNDLRQLPSLSVAADDELLAFVELHDVRGIGWVDLQLLVSALRSRAMIWTTDRKLEDMAKLFRIAASI